MKNRILILTLILMVSCNTTDTNIASRDSILSATVAFAYSDSSLQSFLQNPSKAYISGYFYFQEDLANDVVFGLDIEWFEGVENPINFPGADWMAFVGLTRDGTVWIPKGTPENLNGTPTNDNWEITTLNQQLQPNIWYKMTIEANFDTLKFVSLKVEGGTIDTELNLSNVMLQYPNYASFDNPTLTFYVFAARSKNNIGDNHISANSQVFFDDLEGGIETNNNYEIIFQNGFENQSEILNIPINDAVIPLSTLEENRWYYENENAKISIVNSIQRSGSNSMRCSADLRL